MALPVHNAQHMDYRAKAGLCPVEKDLDGSILWGHGDVPTGEEWLKHREQLRPPHKWYRISRGEPLCADPISDHRKKRAQLLAEELIELGKAHRAHKAHPEQTGDPHVPPAQLESE